MSWDSPEECSIFIEEEFATFDCNNHFANGVCDFSLISQIPWCEKGAWAIFSTFNLDVFLGVTKVKPCSGIQHILQGFHVELPISSEFGYLQLLCVPERVKALGQVYSRREVLTIYVYRNRRVRRVVVHPNLITLNPSNAQTYVPMVPGQHLQLVFNDALQIEHPVGDCLSHVPRMDKLFVICGEQMRSHTYVCCGRNEKIEPIFISSAKKQDFKCVMVPPLTRKDQEVYATVLQPITQAVVYADGLDGLDIICPNQQDCVVDELRMDLINTDEGVSVHFKESMNTVCIQRDKDNLWVLPDLQPLTGRI
jgi:hypothetical protein